MLVVLYGLPPSLEHWQQYAGRLARGDGVHGHCVLFHQVAGTNKQNSAGVIRAFVSVFGRYGGGKVDPPRRRQRQAEDAAGIEGGSPRCEFGFVHSAVHSRLFVH